MTGKGVVLLVASFIYIFSIYQMNMGNVSTKAASNYVDYFARTVAHELALSAMNIGAAKVYEDSSYRTDFTTDFQDGTMKAIFGTGTDTLNLTAIGEYEGFSDTVVAHFGYTSMGIMDLLNKE